MPDDPAIQREVEDIDLVLRIMEGDEEALRDLLELQGPKVRGALFRKYGHSVPAPVLDDAFHRTAYRVWRKADQFDDSRGSLGGWMTKIAIREVINILREGRPGNEVALEDLTMFPDTARELPQMTSGRTQQLSDLKDIVGSLPQHQRVVTEMDIASGCNADNALLAESLGTSKGSIYVSRVKAREKIELEMKRRGHFR